MGCWCWCCLCLFPLVVVGCVVVRDVCGPGELEEEEMLEGGHSVHSLYELPPVDDPQCQLLLHVMMRRRRQISALAALRGSLLLPSPVPSSDSPFSVLE
ncbi:hypothetical protein GDO81_004031 [Engystomops pustulosus]|uniref:Secreted protein n=1 Tax=Engystomops pustulosus TaxID=76066 RepID=A0AAV6ZQ16_ENGPU|nr:hypothetical protein GDO81_004031 [Engystomops pustulosus]